MTGTGAAGGRQGERLGYLGLGLMGFPMTRRLLMQDMKSLSGIVQP